MPFEYEALVGHVFVVGGRAISAPPPGALVEVAPRRAARGREADTVFVLVIPSGDSPAPARFYESLAQMAVERYFESTGSVTSGLRSVFNAINQNLFDHNNSGKRAYEASVLCAVLRGSDLIVGRIGPAVVMLLHNGRASTFPEDLNDDDALFTAPLGVHPVPNVRMKQFRVGSGSRMVMGDPGLADFERERVEYALMSQDLSMTLALFKEMTRIQATMLAVEFLPPNSLETPAIPIGESSAALTKKVETAPPEPEAGAGRPARRSGDDPLTRGARRGVSVTALGMSRLFNGVHKTIDHFFPDSDGTGDDSGTPPQDANTDDENATKSRTAATDSRPDETDSRPEEEESPPKRRGSRINSTILASAALLLPIAVMALVLVFSLAGTGETAFERCLNEARSRAGAARSAPSNDTQATLELWTLTLNQVENCLQQRPENEELVTIRTEGQVVIDRLNQITRREAGVIAALQGATLTDIVLSGRNLYVLDSTLSIVYRVELTADGRGIVGSVQTLTNMRRNAAVQGYQITDLLDITFDDEANVIMALDSNGVLVSCSPQIVLECEAQQLLGTDAWINPVAMLAWNGRVYVLDTGAGDGQIWRYERSAGQFSRQPAEYFGGLRPNLRGAVDFAIDEAGNAYVLLNDGLVQKFFAGEGQPFEYGAMPERQPLTGATALYLDPSPIAQRLYILSQSLKAVYEVGLAGTFDTLYKVTDESLFDLVADIAATSSPEIIYVVSGNAILAFDAGG